MTDNKIDNEWYDNNLQSKEWFIKQNVMEK